MVEIPMRHLCRVLAPVAILAGDLVAVRAQALPPPPVPPQNTLTEPKRVLGKILFWDEHLSSNETVACGTCHQAGVGGGDGRITIHPGPDGVNPSPDDIVGSAGIVRLDPGNSPVSDPVFGTNPQVTARSAPAFIGAAWFPDLFWDGRARSAFTNPETGSVSIPVGGALESQAVGPILNSVEMAHADRTWADVALKIRRALPLGDATNLPPDLAAALASQPSYGDLFVAAFGDPGITAERIAFAIATYERTLVANQTLWDRFIAGD